MRTILLVLFVTCTAMAFGQTASVLSGRAAMMQLPENPQHASPHAMGMEQSIVGGSADNYRVEHGERPLWEFGPVSQEPSLGDVARAYRKEKMTAKKAEIIFEKQGS
jgi:hypothetical protein